MPLTVLDVVSHRFKLEQAADVYKRFHEKKGGIEKVFLEVCPADLFRVNDKSSRATDQARASSCGWTYLAS